VIELFPCGKFLFYVMPFICLENPLLQLTKLDDRITPLSYVIVCAIIQGRYDDIFLSFTGG